ncbi:YraN family protein [bacterium]|nr:MAG: YraN family protein [bacterium]
MTEVINRDLGKKGEDLACQHLEQKGYTILERNYHFMKAEVDIVAYYGFQIIFVEVKLRSSKNFGNPEDFVDEKKQQHVYEAADAWLYERKMEGSPCRFDVIAIYAPSETEFYIEHFENAF